MVATFCACCPQNGTVDQKPEPAKKTQHVPTQATKTGKRVARQKEKTTEKVFGKLFDTLNTKPNVFYIPTKLMENGFITKKT
jgi:hypothetical protein